MKQEHWSSMEIRVAMRDAATYRPKPERDARKRLLLQRMGRHAARLTAAVAAVAIHHTWFGIGTRGPWLSMADGAILAALCMTLGWIWEKTSVPTVPLLRPDSASPRSQPEIH